MNKSVETQDQKKMRNSYENNTTENSKNNHTNNTTSSANNNITAEVENQREPSDTSGAIITARNVLDDCADEDNERALMLGAGTAVEMPKVGEELSVVPVLVPSNNLEQNHSAEKINAETGDWCENQNTIFGQSVIEENEQCMNEDFLNVVANHEIVYLSRNDVTGIEREGSQSQTPAENKKKCKGIGGCFSMIQSLLTRYEIFPGWPPYTENAYHTIPYIKCVEKCLSYNFHTISKNGWKLV